MSLTRREKWLMKQVYNACKQADDEDFEDWLNPPWVLRQNAASYPKHIPTREEEFEFDAPSNWISADEPPAALPRVVSHYKQSRHVLAKLAGVNRSVITTVLYLPDGSVSWHGYNVTHWQPLPEGPEE